MGWLIKLILIYAYEFLALNALIKFQRLFCSQKMEIKCWYLILKLPWGIHKLFTTVISFIVFSYKVSYSEKIYITYNYILCMLYMYKTCLFMYSEGVIANGYSLK